MGRFNHFIVDRLVEGALEQAIEAGNKGWDAAASAVEMVSLGAALDAAGL